MSGDGGIMDTTEESSSEKTKWMNFCRSEKKSHFTNDPTNCGY